MGLACLSRVVDSECPNAALAETFVADIARLAVATLDARAAEDFDVTDGGAFELLTASIAQ